MKKLIFFLFLLILARNGSAQLINFGLKAGVNVSNFVGADFEEIEAKALVGFHGGVILHIKINRLVIQPELLFSSQGATLEHAGVDSNFKVSYINIPVMIKWETRGGFYLEAGPQIGFKASEDIPDDNIEEFLKSTDFSLAAGLGFHSPKGFGIGGRYTISAGKVGEFNAGAYNPDFQNGVIQLSLFYTFFKKKNKSK
jgi:Outer membrane protein beta-barrel domain